MRLLNVDTFRFKEFHREIDVPQYVVASHRWLVGMEAMIDDIEHRKNTDTKGYEKVEGFAKYVREHISGVDWLWIDTCCITQHSVKEVDEAVRSMFRWYEKALICLAYMADVVDPRDKHQFEASQWHHRGWTLQELLAPPVVIFLSLEWKVIGNKISKEWTNNHKTCDIVLGLSLVPSIAAVTRIPECVMYDYKQSKKLTVEERLAWTIGRETTKGEDMYYSLLGIFGIDMRLSYGEGRADARARLLRKIAKSAQCSHQVPHDRPVQQPWLTPRRANDRYTGYTHILDYLEVSIMLPDDDRPDRRQIIVVLSGMGGVGKSETVLQFINKCRKGLRERLWAVLWVDCSSEMATKSDLKRISSIFEWGLADEELVDGVRDRLASSSAPSILVLDNCDDASMNYNRYIPDSEYTTVILTTRLSDARHYASRALQSKNSRNFVCMHGLDHDSAVNLMLDLSGTEFTDLRANEASRIVKALDFNPLSIKVAGSLVESAVYTLTAYASALETKLWPKNRLDTESELTEYKKIRATFEVSAQVLAESSDASARNALALLDILAFMNHRGVTEDIFVRAWQYEETILARFKDQRGDVLSWYRDHDEDMDGNKHINVLSPWHVANCRLFLDSFPLHTRIHAFRTARTQLARLSLITLDAKTGSISMHLLIYAWAKQRMPQPYKAWLTAACALALSAERCVDWQPFLPQLEPHIVANFASFTSSELGREASGIRPRQLCRTLYNHATQLIQVKSSQQIDLCEQLVRQTQALSIDKTNEEEVTEAQCLLAVAYRRRGRVEEALRLLEQVVKSRATLGEDHPRRLAAQQGLAGAYLDHGQVTQAIELLEHVVRVKTRSLPVNNPSRLSSQHILARAYCADSSM
ncbi:hypothetical protein LTR15_012914 [Elasticomyces elasticus]|nr:hypothetical protein LTR15_012914 [Elasticomyces elasticus]